MTVLDIEKAIAHKYRKAIYLVDRVYLFDHHNESDFVAITNGYEYAYEFEIKLSREDFNIDFIKNKHACFENIKKEIVADQIPNKFFFVVPEGLVTPGEVPAYAGLIHVTEFGTAYTVKNAPFLHKSPFNLYKRLLKKVYWKKGHWKDTIEDQKRKIRELEWIRDHLEANLIAEGLTVWWADKEKMRLIKVDR